MFYSFCLISLIVLVLLFFYNSIFYFISIVKKRADVADIAWGGGFFLVAWVSFFLTQRSLKGMIIDCLITLWAFRLSMHIFFRSCLSGEDFRYSNLKKNWQKKIGLQTFLKIFLFQALLLFVIASPLIWIHIHAQSISIGTFVILLPVWFLGFLIEAISDYQLFCFQRNKDNRGKILQNGLWKLSRHPNYLGEMINWWVIWLFAFALPFGWIFIISPLLISFLIIRISGIRPVEEKMKNRSDFFEYAKKTPILAPNWFWIGLFCLLIGFILLNYEPFF